jgi:adenine-specific DNA-methyltransferase
MGLDKFNPIRNRIITVEALKIVKALGLPRAQQNERSALTLLALLDIKPETPWREASAPLMGITPIMDYIRDHYGKNYAPNTRETIRRQTMHQFVEASIAVANPDDPTRPINSPKWRYQVTPEALELLRTYGTGAWEQALENYLGRVVRYRSITPRNANSE